MLSMSCNLQFKQLYGFIWAKCSEFLEGFCGLSPFCWFPWQFSWRTQWTLECAPPSLMRKNPSQLPKSRPLLQNQWKVFHCTSRSSSVSPMHDCDPVILLLMSPTVPRGCSVAPCLFSLLSCSTSPKKASLQFSIVLLSCNVSAPITRVQLLEQLLFLENENILISPSLDVFTSVSDCLHIFQAFTSQKNASV